VAVLMGQVFRAVVVSTEVVQAPVAERVRTELQGLARGREIAVHLVAPVLATSALKHQMGDVDMEVGPARRRLNSSLEALREAGLDAVGAIGDADPVQAISDELLKKDGEHVLLVVHAAEEDTAYAEQDLFENVKRDIEVPVTELRVTPPAGKDNEGTQKVVERDTGSAGAERAEEGGRVSKNLPRIRKRDAMGLAAGFLGTAVLFILAGSCPEQDSLREGFGGCEARLLLAGAAFLINLGHLGALILMESVKYHGPFERFFARLSLYGTLLAIVVSLLLT
jgi:hypothetical protein